MLFKKKEDLTPEETKQELLLRVRPIFAEHLKIDEEMIIPSARLIEDLGVDSLDIGMLWR